jgi:hypothetical protein
MLRNRVNRTLALVVLMGLAIGTMGSLASFAGSMAVRSAPAVYPAVSHSAGAALLFGNSAVYGYDRYRTEQVRYYRPYYRRYYYAPRHRYSYRPYAYGRGPRFYPRHRWHPYYRWRDNDRWQRRHRWHDRDW